jgi:phage-related protein
MNDLSLPAYIPVYPVTKTVKPRQRATTMPEWGIEQRVTRGQNQTSPEWKLKWILRPIEANTLDFFFAERAKGGEWFRWTPPTGTGGRFRCDNWSKQVVACYIWEVEATIREVFSYDLPLIAPDVAVLSLSGLPSSFVYNRIFSANAGSITLTIAFDALASDNNFDALSSLDSLGSVGLFKTRPIYANTGVFQLTGTNTSVLWGRVMPATTGTAALSLKPATLLYFSLSSDYFVSMFDQVYGWDRDFQVDWWGD